MGMAAGRGAGALQERLTPDASIEEVSLVELQAAMGLPCAAPS